MSFEGLLICRFFETSTGTWGTPPSGRWSLAVEHRWPITAAGAVLGFTTVGAVLGMFAASVVTGTTIATVETRRCPPPKSSRSASRSTPASLSITVDDQRPTTLRKIESDAAKRLTSTLTHQPVICYQEPTFPLRVP